MAAHLIWCLPIWEARASFAAVFRGLLGKKAQQTPGLEVESDDGKDSTGEETGRKVDMNEKEKEVA